MRTILLASAALLSACTADQATRSAALGQLFCATGPTIVKLASPSGAAVLAQGASKLFVDAACATINGIAVSPPGTPVPTVTIVPPTITVPLREAL